MGYYTSFSGTLKFNRPLTFSEIEAMPESDALELVTETEQRTTPEGRLEIVTATGIQPEGDEMKAYDFPEQLDAMLAALPSDVTVRGEIRGEGEDAGDVRRYVVEDGRAKELKARLVWDDGYSEAGRA